MSAKTKVSDMEFPHGKPLDHDPNFKGPLEKRSCTDVICCFIFLAFIIVWVCFAMFALMWGNPERLTHPTDSKNRICGVERPGRYNFTSKPFLYFFDLTKCVSYSTVFEGCATPQVCVEKCPDYYFSYLQMDPRNPLAAAQVPGYSFDDMVDQLVCVGDHVREQLKTFEDVKLAVDSEFCTSYVVSSHAVVGRCIPAVIVDATNYLAQQGMDNITHVGNDDGKIPNSTTMANAEGFVKLMLEAKRLGEKVLADLQQSWWQIIAFLVAAAVISFIWTVLIRFFGGLMVWITIFAVVTILALATGFCWYKYFSLKAAGGSTDWNFELTTDVKSYFDLPNTFFVFGAIVSILLLIVLLLLIYLRPRIRLAIALITESSKAVGHMMSSLFFPIIPFILQLLVFVGCATVAIYLASWGQEICVRMPTDAEFANITRNNGTFEDVNGTKCHCDKVDTPQEPYCKFVNYTEDSNMVFWLQFFNLFGFFWGTFFATALCELTLAGAFASYYWAFNKPDDVPAAPVANAFYRAVRYHMGTLAFGSLILAIVRMIRVILDYLDNKLKTVDNAVAKFLMKCLKCCFWCLEKFLKFLTKNAYIVVAIYGKNFCASAKESFFLTMRNIVRVVVLDKVTDFLLFLGKLLVTAAIGVVAYYYFSGSLVSVGGALEVKLNYYFVPMIIVIVGSYLICDGFFDVYEMAVDTTFICFLEDSERNDGTPQKPYFMSKELMAILGNENEFQQARRNS